MACAVDAAPDTAQPIDAPPLDADVTPPHVFAISPEDGATDVAVTETVRVQFDEPVNGVSNFTFTLATPSASVTGSVTIIDPYTYMFAPDGGLPAAETITVTLTNGIFDYTGNTLAPFTSSFTTAP